MNDFEVRLVSQAILESFRELEPNAYYGDKDSGFISLEGRYDLKKLADGVFRRIGSMMG